MGAVYIEAEGAIKPLYYISTSEIGVAAYINRV